MAQLIDQLFFELLLLPLEEEPLREPELLLELLPELDLLLADLLLADFEPPLLPLLPLLLRFCILLDLKVRLGCADHMPIRLPISIVPKHWGANVEIGSPQWLTTGVESRWIPPKLGSMRSKRYAECILRLHDVRGS